MASGIKPYPFDEIEPRWQAYWEGHQTFRSPDPGETGSEKPKYYVLDMFPYPSAAGLHVGHLEGYTATDIVARYKRMRGFNVLHPMGWDAFGLPAEQHAIDTGTHPSRTTARNVQNFKRQIKSLGFSYDWQREVNTTDPAYYRWTQWIFLKLFEKGLAYEAEIPVNWCPALGTVLANEEVIDGKSERGGHPVIRKPMRQWVLKITAYAERLLADLEPLDWPESIKEMQRNWIGKSVGAEVDFRIFGCHSEDGRRPDEESQTGILRSCGTQDEGDKIRVFTTRPDTLFGATYMVLAPEHPLVARVTTPDRRKEVDAYVDQSSRKSDLERTDLAKDKTGVFTGGYAVNPVNQQKIPVWIADYVLISYGTGAIMAVPAHDERDFEFATKFHLPIVRVINPTVSGIDVRHPERSEGSRSFGLRPQDDKIDEMQSAFTGDGININSATPDGSFSIDELPTPEAKAKITIWLEQKGIGKKSVQYKLRDWLFSRQRYWGEPIPIVHVDGKPRPVSYDELPVKLPEVETYKPTGTGESPLASIPEWIQVKDPATGKIIQRESNTMPQWAGSCWYYLRYIDAHNDKAVLEGSKDKYWMPVDLYVGGAEHAVLHLLYSRFWHKVLYDIGVVSTLEPFQKLVNQGMILGEDNQKMSKSRGNVVSPDVMVESYGADSVRLYEMFMGPLEMTKPWSTQGVEGVSRFLARIWRLFVSRENQLSPLIVKRAPTGSELKRLHGTIKKVTEDLDNLRFNTAISASMIFINETLKDEDHSCEVMEKFILLLAPFAPHISEELWRLLGHSESLAYETWPVYNEHYLIEDKVEMAVIIDGKVRTRMVVSKSMGDDELRKTVLADPQVFKWLEGKKINKIVVVPGRVVNIVVGS